MDKLRDYIARIAESRRSVGVLFLLSAIEASIAPFPVIALLAPMILLRPERTLLYVIVLVSGSIAGALVGYAIGDYFGRQAFARICSDQQFEDFQGAFLKWGPWIIVGYGVTPAPFQVVTFSSGAMGIGFAEFLVFATIARIIRYTSVAYLILLSLRCLRWWNVSRRHPK